jgi:hypothetical protein
MYYIPSLPFNYWLHTAESLWLRIMYLQSILFTCILAYNFCKWCTDPQKLRQGLFVTKLTMQNIVILCNRGRDSSLTRLQAGSQQSDSQEGYVSLPRSTPALWSTGFISNVYRWLFTHVWSSLGMELCLHSPYVFTARCLTQHRCNPLHNILILWQNQQILTNPIIIRISKQTAWLWR